MLLDSIVQSVLHLFARFRGRKFKSRLGHITSVEVDYKIMSMVILPLPLIQEGQL